MKKRLVLLALALLHPLVAFSSEVESAYQRKSAHLYSEYLKAKELLASSSYHNEKTDRAVVILNGILAMSPGFAPAYYEKGRAELINGHITGGEHELGSLERSVENLQAAVTLEPEFAEAFVLLGHVYTKMHRYEEANKALSEAARIGTSDPWLDLNRAALSRETRDYAESLRRYREVARRYSGEHKEAALSGITRTFREIGDDKRIRASYEAEIANSPGSAWAKGNYAHYLLLGSGDIDGAILWARKALEVSDYGAARLTLASALYTKWAYLKAAGESDIEAQRLFKEAESIGVDSRRVMELMGKYPHTRIAREYLRTIK
ncbi:MAG: hypothetical protein KAG82_12845 [Alcanivoracaceae bacterium]|nr:hypothetical protein [Alcanivoracaceae bacterium]